MKSRFVHQAYGSVRRRTLPLTLAALGIAVLAIYAYRGLLERPFAADDYQWLLNVRGLDFRQVVRAAFDAGAQTHFYRPLVWLLFWAQSQAFDLDPRGYHVVTLVLHLLDAALLGALARRLGAGRRGALLAAGIVALHPAPFEAITWISAQSELLAAALLLAALHLWLPPPIQNPNAQRAPEIQNGGRLLATAALGLALLAKESAVIGLPLLLIADERRRTKDEGPTTDDRRPTTDDDQTTAHASRTTHHTSRFTFYVLRFTHQASRLTHYVLPFLLTAAYIALQVAIERRNYLLQGGGYGIGPQLVLNPLRSLALIVAPLPGTEHADAPWLIPLGAAIALGLAALFARGPWGARRLVLALLLTLLPTAPFASPPDSRYLYLPVMAAALLIAIGIDERRKTKDERLPTRALRPSSPVLSWGEGFVLRRLFVLCSLFFVLALAWAAAGELAARENRFAAASGPGGSLWRTATAACRESAPRQMIVVDPPLAAPHAEAIVHLACGPDVRPLIVSRDQVEGAVEQGSIVIGFAGGSAQVEQRT